MPVWRLGGSFTDPRETGLLRRESQMSQMRRSDSTVLTELIINKSFLLVEVCPRAKSRRFPKSLGLLEQATSVKVLQYRPNHHQHNYLNKTHSMKCSLYKWRISYCI